MKIQLIALLVTLASPFAYGGRNPDITCLSSDASKYELFLAFGEIYVTNASDETDRLEETAFMNTISQGQSSLQTEVFEMYQNGNPYMTVKFQYRSAQGSAEIPSLGLKMGCFRKGFPSIQF